MDTKTFYIVPLQILPVRSSSAVVLKKPLAGNTIWARLGYLQNYTRLISVVVGCSENTVWTASVGDFVASSRSS